MATQKKTTKSAARKTTKKVSTRKARTAVKAAKTSAPRTRISSEEQVKRDRAIVSALKKGVTTSEFRDELKLLTSGSMLSNLRPVAKRTGHKIKQDGTKGKFVYKFIGGGK
jgi:hypothetical protein